jgi:hypothetical protein
MAVVFAVAKCLGSADIVAEGLLHPEEVAARMEIMAIFTHNVVRGRPPRAYITMAVETGGAGV